MNYKIVLSTLGQIVRVTGLLLSVPLLSAIIMGEAGDRQIVCAFIVPMIICLSLGTTLSMIKPSDKTLYAKEGIVIVGVGWIVVSVIGALPLTIGTLGRENFLDLSFIDWLFESVSGFTTTGSSILHATSNGHQIDLLYACGCRSILLWRSFMHWIGGMGVLVFVLAMLPSLSGASGLHLMKQESTGPTVGKLVSKMSSTARILYLIYAIMTAVEIVMLSLSLLFDGTMNVFHAFVLSFGTAGTGGFAATSASLASHGLYVQVVVTVFMFLFGINFNLYFCLLMGKIKDVLKSEELRLYSALMLIAIITISLNVWASLGSIIDSYSNYANALGEATFTVVSLMTSTGYAIADFTVWPSLSQGALIAVMFIGACSGSTGGGFKCSRFLILVKSAIMRCRKVVNPRAVFTVKMDGKKIDDEVTAGVNGYFVIYALILLLATFVIMIDVNALGADSPIITAFTTSLTCLNNVGPGMTAIVGPNGSFFAFNGGIKILLSVLMLFGRLEIYPILLLISPRTYSRKA
ncbi:MAG: TrkH family potassium uptake protein [Clostridia bacterium]|nr:TrkH family potassium uptake protein [Clostridia bacterium]